MIELSKRKRTRGFTLIELLIVIAIILILIAIALPNFLEAQIRARVTKARGEIRSIHIAMESYFLDWNMYPAEHERDQGSNRNARGLFWLTSPISYITSMPADPFGEFSADSDDTNFITYEMGGIELGFLLSRECPVCQVTYALFSNGPNNEQDIWQDQPHSSPPSRDAANYSATNGTKSRGELLKWGGDAFWIGYDTDTADRGQIKKGLVQQPGLYYDNQLFFSRFPATGQ